MNKLKNWVLKQKNSPYAAWVLFLLAFAESSFFPIPPDVLLIAILTLNPLRWKKFALITLVGSLLGGIAGYLIGFGAFNL
ncbi:MAG: DedA family protein, partial [Patescibacteria group bacterium]